MKAEKEIYLNSRLDHAFKLPPRWWKAYRVVEDQYAGYEAQVWRLWWPFWHQCFIVNTSRTIEGALTICDRHANGRKVVVNL